MFVLHRPRTAVLAIVVCALAIIAAGGDADAAQAGCDSGPETIVGNVVALASSVRQDGDGTSEPPSVSFLIRTDDGLVGVTLTEDARVTASDGRSTPPGEVPLSARVRACGRHTGPMQFEATSIELLPYADT
ncbi:MAG: hypothetical protein ACRDJE_01615 [Dehalococcoidia bacterium]